MIDYPTCIAAVFVAVLFGGAVGMFLVRQHATLELARLRLLLDLERERCDCLSEIVARIEEAGEWEE